MLKISQIGPADQVVTLRLEGRIVGPWVGEACDFCENILHKGRRLKLNLTDVFFADQEGVKLLKKLIAGGVTLTGCSLFVEEQLKATSKSNEPPSASVAKRKARG